ncbi:MAG: tetratricopeptide repeat protein [Deltaproteobacteria bacterium]|nr:tetratricopeptide repeat protein [Deltaproteobacteria bacterium]
MNKKVFAVPFLALTLALFFAVAPALAADPVDDIQAGNEAAREGNFERAIELYNRAIESGLLSPGNLAVVYNNRGSALDDSGQVDQAIVDYTKAVKLDPSYAEAYYNRSFAYEKKKEFAKALADVKKAASLDPADPLYSQRREYLKDQVSKHK